MKRTRAKKPSQWPPFRYEVKGDHIRIINPAGSTSKQIPPPEQSSRRLYEIYKVAYECLVKNVRSPLATARAEATEEDAPQFSIVRPSEYKTIFEALNLHKLPLEVMIIRNPGSRAYGQTRGICKVCFAELTGEQRLYCSEECHNVWKQRRARGERGRKAVRSSSSSKKLPRCPDCNHLMALHKTGQCVAQNCHCKF